MWTLIHCTMFYTSLHCTMHLTTHSFTLKLCNATIDLKHSALFYTALNCFHQTALYNKEIMPPLKRDNLLSRHVTQYSVQGAGPSVWQEVFLCSVHKTAFCVKLTMCSLQWEICSVQFAVWSLQGRVGSVKFAGFSVQKVVLVFNIRPVVCRSCYVL